MMNTEQIMKLFSENCFLIGTQDVVSCADAVKIFGEDAVNYAKKIGKDKRTNYNIYYVNADNYVEYLHLSGFLRAATFYNMIEITGKQPEFRYTLKNKPKEKLIQFPAKSKDRKKAEAEET